MSVFAPMSFGAGQNDQKKSLLDKLMQQYQEAASRAAGLSQAQSLAGAVGSTPFHAQHPFGGLGLYTALAHVLPPELIARLGPGGIGIPSPGHSSSAPGQGVGGGHPGNSDGGHPQLGSGGPGVVIQPHNAATGSVPGYNASSPTVPGFGQVNGGGAEIPLAAGAAMGAIGSGVGPVGAGILSGAAAAANQVVQRRKLLSQVPLSLHAWSGRAAGI